MTSEKPVLHYITHTYSCRKQSRLEVSAANTCKQTRSRLDAGRSASFWHAPSVHETRGNHHPFSTFPHARCCAAGPTSRGRSRPGKVRRHWRRGGRLSPRPETRGFPTAPIRSPRAEHPGAARAALRTARADVQRHDSSRDVWGSPIAVLHYISRNPGFSLSLHGGPHSPRRPNMSTQMSTREQSGRPRLERQPQSCARDDTPITSQEAIAIWLNLPEEQADLKD